MTAIDLLRAVAPDEGAPLGPLYAACMSYGISLDAFTQIIDGLCTGDQVFRV